LPEKFEVGEVVSTAADFYSSRMTNAERGSSLVDELMKDYQMKKFASKKVRMMSTSAFIIGIIIH